MSTIIPVHNRPGMLREAVGSVLAQTYRPIEVVIVDDGSTDETPAAAGALERDHRDVVQHVRIEQSGPGPAREAGRLAARGEFIQYLDSDDRLLPGKFDAQVSALQQRPECGVAYGVSRLIDENAVVLAERYKWTGRQTATLFPWLLVDRWWCTHTPLYRRSVCDRVGSWSSLRYSQDWEYDARVGGLGTRLAFCDLTVSEHRHHDGARQTGRGKWLAPSDRVRFFTTLFENAVRAGTHRGDAEMQHFSRWMFSEARTCGALGDEKAAAACFELAVRARGDLPANMAAYRAVAGWFGWRATGKLADGLRRFVPRRSSSNTMQQSWMST